VPYNPRGASTAQSFMKHNRFTEPQPPVTMDDICSVVPKKAYKRIKTSLKEKHISKTEMCDRVQWTIEWLKMVCINIVLPAVFVCLKEERMTKNAKGGQIFYKSTKEASLIGESIFVSVMRCLRNKISSILPEAKCSLDDVMTSPCSLETIPMFKKDLINCVYLELLANGMGKNLPVDDMKKHIQPQSFILCWEFYMTVVHYFCQRASWHHMESLLGLPHTIQDDLSGSMTKAERTTLNVLTKTLTDTVTDMISEATEHPFWIADIIRQGQISVSRGAGVENCFKEFDELSGRSSSEPATPKSEKVFSPSTETEKTARQPNSTEKEKKKCSFFSRIRKFFCLKRKHNRV
ncbi:hypothetical protein IRJ41_001798, partial [Triplophysa rosa]